jgi:hypothetical protein
MTWSCLSGWFLGADITVLEGQSIKNKRGILHAGASVYTMSDHHQEQLGQQMD